MDNNGSAAQQSAGQNVNQAQQNVQNNNATATPSNEQKPVQTKEGLKAADAMQNKRKLNIQFKTVKANKLKDFWMLIIKQKLLHILKMKGIKY